VPVSLRARAGDFFRRCGSAKVTISRLRSCSVVTRACRRIPSRRDRADDTILKVDLRAERTDSPLMELNALLELSKGRSL
jgi:hypothetical protein